MRGAQVSYPGGKGAAGVFQTIINQQPPHDVYIEPFLGGGSVLLAKRPTSTNIGIDVDRDVVCSWRARSLKNVRVIWGDAIAHLETRRWSGSELIYCDPPYPLGARARPRSIYRHEMTDQQHKRLLDVLVSLPCKVQVSSYWNELYAGALRHWRLLRFQGWSRGGATEECLWMNYPQPVELHDYRYVGDSYRERERIRRKALRWAARVHAMPRLERQAVLSAILTR